MYAAMAAPLTGGLADTFVTTNVVAGGLADTFVTTNVVDGGLVDTLTTYVVATGGLTDTFATEQKPTSWSEHYAKVRRHKWANGFQANGINGGAVNSVNAVNGSQSWQPLHSYRGGKITARRAAAVLLGASPTTTNLAEAATKFAEVLGAYEQRLCSVTDAIGGGVVIPNITAADVREFASSVPRLTDPDQIAEIVDGARSAVTTASQLATASQLLPDLPPESYTPSNNAALKMERAVIPYVSVVEGVQKNASRVIGSITAKLTGINGVNGRAVDGRVVAEGGSDSKISDALAADWTFAEKADTSDSNMIVQEVELRDGELASTKHGHKSSSDTNSNLLGLSRRTDWRDTLLHPHTVFNIGIATSPGTNHKPVEWVFVNSPEARYAVRIAGEAAGDISGGIPTLNSIRAKLLPLLHGTPPHKIKVAQYCQLLTNMGYQVLTAPQREGTIVSDDYVRFTRSMLYTGAELAELRAHSLSTVGRLSADAVDISDIESKVRAFTSGARERGGDIEAEERDGKLVLTVVKIRDDRGPGGVHLPWETSVPRTTIDFHTTNKMLNAPTAADIAFHRELSAEQGLAWTVVVTPAACLMFSVNLDTDAVTVKTFKNKV
jgi:hypothetical protein